MSHDFPDRAINMLLPHLGEYGFQVVDSEAWLVRFENDRVWLACRYGERDSEVSLTFGRKGEADDLSFVLLLRRIAPRLAREIGDGIAESDADVDRLLGLLARGLSTSGRSILEGNDEIFEEATSIRWWDFKPDALK